ncbi:hypothetical protein R6Q57_012371 [Mikania cordata]
MRYVVRSGDQTTRSQSNSYTKFLLRMDVLRSSPSQFQILIARLPLGIGMTKFRWNQSMNMFLDHVDPEKEQQKQIVIETDTKVERIVKLVKSVNSVPKEAKQRN